MSLSLDFGLGESGLAQAGVGLGGAGLEGGVAAAAPAGIVVGAGVAYGQTAVNGDMVFTLPAHNNGDLLALAHYIARTDDLNDFVLVTTPGWVELAAAERRVFSLDSAAFWSQSFIDTGRSSSDWRDTSTAKTAFTASTDPV